MGRLRTLPSTPCSQHAARLLHRVSHLGTVATAGEVDVAKHQATQQSFARLYPLGYLQFMKLVRFLGDSLKRLREFPGC